VDTSDRELLTGIHTPNATPRRGERRNPYATTEGTVLKSLAVRDWSMLVQGSVVRTRLRNWTRESW
jgi:hypothetical protein